MSPGELAALRGKYETLATLRARREALESVGGAGFDEAEGRARGQAFRAVATEFPGALRELEITPAAVLRAKRDAVAAAAAGQGAVAPWMRVVFDFHAHVREVLALKRWLAERRDAGEPLDDGDVAACRAWAAARAVAVGATAGVVVWDGSRAALDAWRRPAGGRFLPQVLAILAIRHGCTPADVETAVFGRPDGL